MKSVVYAPAALDSFDDILEYTADTFGEAQAVTYSEQLVARIEALAAGAGPRARPCEFLMRGNADVAGLTYYREASHFLILLETADTSLPHCHPDRYDNSKDQNAVKRN